MGTIETVAAYLSLAISASVVIINLSKIILEWLSQRHSIRTGQIEQSNQIIMQYLNKALDQNIPLSIRQQLLRFLATPEKADIKLQVWAKLELDRIGSVIDELNQAVRNAEKELQEAKNQNQIKSAEQKLTEAIKNQHSIFDLPSKPKISEYSLRAGLIEDKDLTGLNMKGKNLNNMILAYRNLYGANFSDSDLTGSSLQGCDLRVSTFENANLDHTAFYHADLRGAIFKNAKFNRNMFQGAKLEGANFEGCTFVDVDLRATYDDTTIWPEGFEPTKHGAVYIEKEE